MQVNRFGRTQGALMGQIDIRLVGDAAVLAIAGDSVDPQTLRRVWSLYESIRATLVSGILDIVPAYASVLVRFDPALIDLPRVIAGIRGAAERPGPSSLRSFRAWTVHVCFGGAHGIDFETAAHALGMREARFRDALCKPEYRVAFLGFVAGFPYLIGLPPSLQLPRHATPRPRVPAGSVAIAGLQCGIYPRPSPGGWHVVGQTQVMLFDPSLDEPALLRPGDAVRFVPVERFSETAHVQCDRLAQ